MKYHIIVEMRYRWYCKRVGRGRPIKAIYLSSLPKAKRFIPEPHLKVRPIQLSYPEYEAVKLLDLRGMTHEEAAKRMSVSRGTTWRLVKRARRKIALAIMDCRPIVVVCRGEVEEV